MKLQISRLMIVIISLLACMPYLVSAEETVSVNSERYAQEEISSTFVFGCARGGYYIEHYVYSNGYSVSVENERFGYIDPAGEVVIPHRYAYARNFSEGLAAVQDADNHHWGYINKQGDWVLPSLYLRAEPFSDGLGAVKDPESGKWGFVNQKGEIAIPFQYEDVHLFTYGLAEVQKNGQWGVIDTNGNVVIPFEYTEVMVPEDCLKSPYWGEHITFRLIDQAAKTNTVSLFSKPKKQFIVKRADSVLLPVDGLIRVERDNKFGYVDLNGEVIIPLKYDQLEPFSEGLAVAGRIDYNAGHPKYGYINPQGEIVIPLIYGKAGDFSEGVATVGVQFIDAQGLWELKLIDPNGETVRGDLIYTGITMFLNGVAVVDKIDPITQQTKYGLMDKSGVIVMPLEYDQYDWVDDTGTGKMRWVLTKFDVEATEAEADTGYQPVPSGVIDSMGNMIDFEPVSEAEVKVGVVLNGATLLLEPAAKIMDGRTIIPLRGIFEKMGAHVQYNPADQSIDITHVNAAIHLQIDNLTAQVNGVETQLTVAPFVDETSRSTYVPLRFISEMLGAKVEWDAAANLAVIEMAAQ